MLDLFSLFAVVFFAALAPGPDILFIVRTSLTKGFIAGFTAILGITSSLCFYVALVLLGLNNLSDNVYFILGTSSFGACYLVSMAISSWSACIKLQEGLKQQERLSKTYIQGFLTNLSNPKAMIFFTVILSPFLQQEMLFLQGFAMLMGSFLAHLLVVSLLSRIKNILKPKHTLAINRIGAVIFFAFAMQLLYNAYSIVYNL